MTSIDMNQDNGANPQALPVHSLLGWVQTSQSDESIIWWPCLLFESKKFLHQYLKCDVALKSAIYLELHRHDPKGRGKVAFLLGRNRPKNSQVILVPTDKESILLKDFFDHVDDMDEVYGDDSNWREAYGDARQRLLSSQQDLHANNSECSESGGVIKSGDEARSMAVTVEKFPMMIEEKNGHTMVLDPAQTANAAAELPNSTLPVPFLATDADPNPNHHLRDEKSTSIVPASQQNESSEAAKLVKKMRPLTPSPKADNVPVVIRETRASHESKTKRKIPKLANWSLVWKILSEDYGYSQRRGAGVFKLYYLTPQFQHQSLEHIRKNGHLERDYFSTVEALQKHVKEKFHWNGAYDRTDESQSNSKKAGRKSTDDETAKSTNKKSIIREKATFAEIKILSDEEAWKRLSSTKYGFREIQSFYCLPGIDPKNARFKLGHHYFRDLKSLRRNLCAFGIPDPNKYLLDDLELAAWLRLTVSTQVQGLKRVPPFEALDGFSKAWNIFLKIGFKFRSTGYTLPNKERSFENEYDMLRHLSRFGIPHTATFDNIDNKTLLALELYIADFIEEKRKSWLRLPFCEEEEKLVKKDDIISESPSSADEKAAVESSVIVPKISVHRKAEESEADSFFSRSSSPMNQHNSKISTITKGKRIASKISGFDEAMDDVARAKKASRKSVSEGRVDVSQNKIPSKTLLESSSDLSFSVEGSEQDSPFSKSSSCKSVKQDKLAPASAKDIKKTAHSKSKVAKSPMSLKNPFKKITVMAKDMITTQTEKPEKKKTTSISIKRLEVEQDSPFSKSSSCKSVKQDKLAPASAKDIKKTAHSKSKVAKSPMSLKNPFKKITVMAKDMVTTQTEKPEKKKTTSISIKRLEDRSTMKVNEKLMENLSGKLAGSVWTILSDDEAWAWLTKDKYGFKLQKDFFCLPGVDPSQSRFREGHDFFKDLKSLRKNLCAFGIPDPNRHILEDEELCNWICLSVSTVIDGLRTVPPYDPIRSFPSAWTILSKIGFKYSPVTGYHFPNKERNFNEAYDIWCYLSRFGLPSTASPQKIDQITLLALELFLADFPSERRKLWKRLSFDTDYACLPFKEQSQSRRNSLENTFVESTQGKVFTDEHNRNAVSESPQSISLWSNMMDCDNSLGSLESIAPSTIGEELQRSIKALSPLVLTNHNIFSGSEAASEFSKQRERVIDFLRVSIKNYQEGKNSFSSTLYVCGGPGVGKTTTVNDCIKIVASECQSSYGLSPLLLSINGAHVHSSSSLLSEIADVLDEKVVDKIGNRLKKINRPLILVLDEIDLVIRLLLNSKGDNSMSNIFSWASDSDYKFILIGISNSVGNKDAKKILEKFDQEIVFQPYSEDDMVAIIDKRLGPARNLVEASAIKFAAKKVSKLSGDIRQVLNVVMLAFTKCLDELSSDVLNKAVDQSVWVKLRHVMLALKDSGALPLANIISHLPQSCKSVLCIAVALQSCIPPRSPLTLGMLKKYCAEASSHSAVTLENTSNESYVDIVHQLADSGLFTIGGSDIFFNMTSDPMQMQLSIQCGMDDVECAMGETLFNQSFFKTMFDSVRKSWQ